MKGRQQTSCSPRDASFKSQLHKRLILNAILLLPFLGQLRHLILLHLLLLHSNSSGSFPAKIAESVNATKALWRFHLDWQESAPLFSLPPRALAKEGGTLPWPSSGEHLAIAHLYTSHAGGPGTRMLPARDHCLGLQPDLCASVWVGEIVKQHPELGKGKVPLLGNCFGRTRVPFPFLPSNFQG